MPQLWVKKVVGLYFTCVFWLQSEFCSLTHLVKLDLSKNQLQQLPSDFGRLVNLQHLDLLNNRLVTLPVSFAQLKVTFSLSSSCIKKDIELQLRTFFEIYLRLTSLVEIKCCWGQRGESSNLYCHLCSCWLWRNLGSLSKLLAKLIYL